MKKWMYTALIVVFAAIFLVSAGFLVHYYWNSSVQDQQYDDLAQIMEDNTVTPRPTDFDTDTTEKEDLSALVEVTDPETGETVRLLPQFKDLYLHNNQMVGWLIIPGTEISYPVMQTPEQPDYYLKHNFKKENSDHGCLYAREVCDINKPSDNITIYGHRMKDGTMFARLDKFMERSFFEENPYIYFDTLQEQHTYQVLSVFRTSATVGKGFAYHAFVDAGNEEEFLDFVDTCKDLSLYDTGVTAAYGDKLITLSTCEYSQENGRLVVVAKRIR